MPFQREGGVSRGHAFAVVGNADHVPAASLHFKGDVAGRRVQAWDAADPSGSAWDLRDAAGRRVPAGVYLVRVTTGGSSVTRKLLVVE